MLLKVNGITDDKAIEVANKFVQEACNKAADKTQWQAILNKNIQKIAQNLHKVNQRSHTPSPPPAPVYTTLPPPPIQQQQQQVQFAIPTSQPQWVATRPHSQPQSITTDQALAACWAAPMYAATAATAPHPWQTPQIFPQNVMIPMQMPVHMQPTPMMRAPIHAVQPQVKLGAGTTVVAPHNTGIATQYMAVQPLVQGRLPTPPLPTTYLRQQHHQQTAPLAATTTTARAAAAVQALHLSSDEQKLLQDFKSYQKWAQENLLRDAKHIATNYLSKKADGRPPANEMQAKKVLYAIQLMEINEEQLMKGSIKLTKEFVTKFYALLQLVMHVVMEVRQKIESKQREIREKTPPLGLPGSNGVRANQICEEMDESMPLMMEEDTPRNNGNLEGKERKNTPSASQRLLELLRRNEKPTEACSSSIKMLLKQQEHEIYITMK